MYNVYVNIFLMLSIDAIHNQCMKHKCKNQASKLWYNSNIFGEGGHVLPAK